MITQETKLVKIWGGFDLPNYPRTPSFLDSHQLQAHLLV